MTTLPEGARAWLEEQLPWLPLDLRPEPEDLVPFANGFASWLETSFDLALDPGEQMRRSAWGCLCPMCCVVVMAPTLRTKKLRKQDKRRAELLKEAWVRALASALDLPRAGITTLLADPALREILALGAYGVVLQDRLAGRPLGPEVLALWRGFAWTREGSPRAGFTLDADLILEAEAVVRDRLRGRARTARDG